MTDEERRIISDYVMRVAGAQQSAAPAASGPWGGRVPQTGAAQTGAAQLTRLRRENMTSG